MLPFLLPDKEVFSLREAARLLGFDAKTLKKGIEDGKIISVDMPQHHLSGLKMWKQIPRHEMLRLAKQKGLIDGNYQAENVSN